MSDSPSVLTQHERDIVASLAHMAAEVTRLTAERDTARKQRDDMRRKLNQIARLAENPNNRGSA